MRIKSKKKIIIASAIMALSCLTIGAGVYHADMLSASATTYTTEKCLTRGKTTSGDSTTTGCPENFQIYMYGSSTSGTRTLYQNYILDWSKYNITVETSKVSSHLSFELKRNGSTYTSKSLSGSDNQTLFSGTLPDGEYELIYNCQYRSNIFVGYTKFEYTFKFEVDNTAPSYTFKAGGTSIGSGSFTNKQIVYTASDKNFDCIRFMKPNTSSYGYCYSDSYTVAATSANNGWWYFYAEDYLGAASSGVSVCLDTVAPVGKVTDSNGNTVSNGGYTNKAIKYTATDNIGVYRYEMKRPTDSSWQNYTSGTSVSGSSGWYYFRSTDRTNNVSEEYKVFYDSGVPTGTLYGGTTSMSSGAYTNASYVKYTAYDAYSGIANCYVRMLGSSSYTVYASGTQLATEGTYYFYCVDRSGNVSPTVSITLDRTSPVGTLYGGSSSKASGAYTNANYVAYTASDSISGVANCYVKMPNSSYYTSYTGGTQLATEGTYYFYSIDKSGNASATVSITLDKTKPTGTLYGGTSVVGSGSSTNAQYVKFVPYDAFGLSATYVKKPNASSYVSYTSGTQLTAEGTYTFYCVDKAGSISPYYTVTLDRHIPAAQLYVDDKPFGNNGYTNGAHIKFECTEKCYVKQPGSAAFQDYVSGTEYYKPGKYVFYGLSEAGTSSGYYSIVIDRTVKTVTFHNVTDGMTDGDVSVSWTDGDADLYAPIKSVTINGKIYQKGATVHTIDTGNYTVTATDAAGNSWTTEFSSTKRNIVTETLQKEYYEAFDANGEYFSFATYESAFAFAQKRESGYVTTGEWNSANWDTGMAMDAKDSVNAVNGRYFVYKKSGNPEENVAYFTEERLNEVIAEYAKQGIEDYYYWEKVPASIADGENLFSYSEGKHILASSVELGQNIGCFLNGEEFVDKVVETEGENVLTVKDEWGNSCDYLLTVIRRAPGIDYAVGEGGKNSAAFDRTYYFKDQVSLSVAELYDEMAMFNVYDEDGELLGNFGIDDVFTVTKSGKYTAEAVNHFGKSETFRFIVSRSSPAITITENTEKKRLEIIVTESADEVSHLETLEILKSTDGGVTWEYVLTDDYGKEVSVETLSYSFCTSGVYKIVVTDEFRTGIDAVTIEHGYEQPCPVGVLKGVNENGYTNGVVTFEWADEAIVTLEKDGERLDYVSGQKLTEDGYYTLIFANRDGFTETHEFVIDTKAPVVTLIGVENGGEVSGDVKAVFGEEELQVELYRNGRAMRSYHSGEAITECGAYRISATDRAFNRTEVVFTIDKVVDFDINVNEKGLANSVTVTAGEELSVELTKDGEAVAYTLGEEITAPAVYIVKLEDKLGNSVERSFTIVKPIVKTFEYNFDDMPAFERVEIGGEERRLNYGTLELKEDGMYEVGVVAGGQTYFFTVTVDSTAPVLTVHGVEANGETNRDVLVTVSEENATLELVKDGVSCGEYVSGTTITEDGSYTVKAIDLAGNKSEVFFVIDKTVDYEINVNEKGLSNSVTVTANEELKAQLTKNGDITEYEIGNDVMAPGEYSLTLTDKLGNQAEVSFVVAEPLVKSFKHDFSDMPNVEGIVVNGEAKTLEENLLELKEDGEYEIGVIVNGKLYTFKITIDATAPTLVLSGVENGGTTKGSVTLTELSEEADMRVYLNGEEIEYTVGEELDGKGEYRVTVTDQCGNSSEYSFEITKGMNGGWIAFIVIGCAVLIGGTVAIVILKKKSIL